MNALAGAALIVAAVLVVGGGWVGQDGDFVEGFHSPENARAFLAHPAQPTLVVGGGVEGRMVARAGSAYPAGHELLDAQPTQQQEEVGDGVVLDGLRFGSGGDGGGVAGGAGHRAVLARTLAPGERVRILTLEQWRAIHASGGSEEPLARIGWCESGLSASAVGAAGEQGAWQVLARFHGPVPMTLAAQATQAAAIMAVQGETPWTGTECAEWTR